MPDSSSQVESTTKRNKASRACKECRRKKIKCNGENPCDRCQRAGHTCAFDALFPSKRSTQHNTRPSPPALSTKVDKEKASSSLSYGYHLGDSSIISVNAAGRPHYFPDWTQQQLNSPITTATQWDTTLVELYFDLIHPLVPMIHRATFQLQLQQGKVSMLLLNAIYAITCLCYPAANHHQQHVSLGLSYYESAFTLLDEALDIPRLSTIQALLLMVKFQEHARPSGYQFRVQLLIDMAYRMCQNLKLSHRWHQDPVHAEQGIRVFWAAYAYIILFSIEQGTHPPIHDIDLPTLLSDEHQHTIDTEAITNFCTQCQIIQLQGKVVSFLRVKYGKEPDEEMNTNEEANLHNHLIDCLDHIQQQHTNNIHTMTRSKIYERESMTYNAQLLQISLHFTTILLHRPYMTNDLKLREKCVVAASTLYQLVDDLIRSTGDELISSLIGLPRSLQQLIYYMAASITISRLVQPPAKKKKQSKASSNTSSKQVDKALDVIHILFKLQTRMGMDDDAKTSTPTFNQHRSHYRYSAPSMMQQAPSSSFTLSNQQQPATQWISPANSATSLDPRTSTIHQHEEIAASTNVSIKDDDPMTIDQSHDILDFT